MALNLDEWIQEQSPITPKLLAKSGEARLRVLKEGWRVGTFAERRWFDRASYACKELFFVREIAMHSRQHVAWYAKTLIPQSTFEKHEALFSRLKAEPLGNLLFNQPGVRRHFFKSFILNPKKQYQISAWVRDAGLADALPAVGFRVSLFTLNEQDPLVLFEVYLDGLRSVL